MLFEIFNTVGPVVSIRVCRDAQTRRSLGYAYVNFHRVEDAKMALEAKNFSAIHGKACRIMWCQRDPSARRSGKGNIFVKNLATSINHEALHDTFSPFGTILSCKVANNGKGESLGYGFVHFEDEKAAAKAIEAVNGKIIADKKVSVAAFKSKKERTTTTGSAFVNVFVKNLPQTAEFQEEQFRTAFAKYGEISSIKLSWDDEKKKSKGFGFVAYTEAKSAQSAVEAGADLTIEGKKVFVGPAQKKEDRQQMLTKQFEKLRLERAKKFAGTNIYVKNLADEVDDDKLRELFAAFGNITSSKIMKTPGGKSKGFGFVNFSTPEEATKCVTEMNGKMLDGKPIYAALAQRKEDRRAKLEMQYSARQKGPQMQMQGGNPQMFYPQMQQRGNQMIYPGQMMPRRWPGPMVGMRAPPMNYMMVPAQGRGRGGRGGYGGRGRKGSQNFKYTNNARNRQQQQQQAPQQVPVQQQQPVPVPAQQAPVQKAPEEGALTAQALAAAPEEKQKEMLGHKLFPLISQRQPELAGKITGMLLEMDNGELLNLIESPSDLGDKIQEAVAVLEEADQPAQE
jgi:polyadenylate-binding protein